MTRWLVQALLGFTPAGFRRRHGEALLAVSSRVAEPGMGGEIVLLARDADRVGDRRCGRLAPIRILLWVDHPHGAYLLSNFTIETS